MFDYQINNKMVDVCKQSVEDILAQPVPSVLYNSNNCDHQLRQLERIQFVNRKRDRSQLAKSALPVINTDLMINTELVSHLPTKHLAETPKFLFSLERKRLRIRNGIESRKQMGSQPERKQFHSEKLRTMQHKYIERCRHTHKVHVSQQPHQWCLVPPMIIREKADLPHFLFNIHHMADRQTDMSMEQVQRRTAKGANTMYYGSSSSQRSRRNTAQSSRSNQSTRVSCFREVVLVPQ